MDVINSPKKRLKIHSHFIAPLPHEEGKLLPKGSSSISSNEKSGISESRFVSPVEMMIDIQTPASKLQQPLNLSSAQVDFDRMTLESDFPR